MSRGLCRCSGVAGVVTFSRLGVVLARSQPTKTGLSCGVFTLSFFFFLPACWSLQFRLESKRLFFGFGLDELPLLFWFWSMELVD